MSKGAEARAVAFLQKYRNAKANDDSAEMVKAGDGFRDVIMYVEPDRRDELMEIYVSLEDAAVEAVFEEFAKAAKNFGEVKDVFEMGEKMAEDGKNALFLPSAATELAKIAGAFKALKVAADKVINEVNDLEEPFREKDAEALLAEGKQAKEALDELLEKFNELKENIENL